MDEAVARVAAVLRENAEQLSDGFGYYLPAHDWLPENEGLTVEEMQEAAFLAICRRIVAAVGGEELRIAEALLAERERVLAAVPECPVHGAGCVPHAVAWIEMAKAAMGNL